MVERFDLNFILLAGRYTLLDQTGLAEFLPLCVERGVKLTIGGPYRNGILARDLNYPLSYDYQPASKHLIDKAKALKIVCDRYEIELRAAALQFVFGHEAVISTVPGAATVAELEDNVQMMQAEIPQGLWDELKAEKLLPEGIPRHREELPLDLAKLLHSIVKCCHFTDVKRAFIIYPYAVRGISKLTWSRSILAPAAE